MQISHYKCLKLVNSRDTRVMVVPHRDKCSDSGYSLVIGLSRRSEYTGGMLRVSTSKAKVPLLNRRQKDSETELQYRGSIPLDVSRGRVCVIKNLAEHCVCRLTSGERSVLVVHLASNSKSK